jgi:cysteine desulfurase/selenocysteine lyase
MDLLTPSVQPKPAPVLDAARVREDFPIFRREIHGQRLVYLDSAATSQKPTVVLDALRRFYELECANVHRGAYTMSEEATRDYEGAREKAARFLNAPESREIVFVRGTTEAINLVAATYGRRNLKPGDEVLITAMEHHSNIVPWQMICEDRGAILRVAPINENGELLMDEFRRMLSHRTRFVSVVHVSNALGTINPVRQIVELAHRWKIPVLLDGAQAAPHLKIDVQQLGCDFYAFSGHKLFGPTGIGVLYGKASLLEGMPPYQGGGDMIRSVTFEKTIYNAIPYKFEAGTPNIAGAIGLGAAIDYVIALGQDKILAHEGRLLAYGTQALLKIPGVRIIGTASQKTGVLSFVVDGIHPHDLSTVLDRQGIAVRGGHHCAQPIMERFGVPATTRASLGVYNTREDIDALVAGIWKAKEVFG